ncbi:MAG: NUDIX domain-containing protein [Deltaproteobacteria bacterium]|nr:NUDIX domain-containing protein [Deltaproteobacteria bacterium]
MTDNPKRQPKDKRVRFISQKTEFQGFSRVDNLQVNLQAHAGGWIGPINREVYIRADAAAVLPYDPLTDQVALLEQFRAGSYLAGENCWQLEPVAGMVDSGEIPQDVMVRETQEELGVSLVRLEPICTYLVSPGYTTERVFYSLGIIRAEEVQGIHGMAQEGEDILTHVLSADEAFQRLDAGEFQYSLTVIGLLWLKLNRDRVRSSSK